MAVPVAQAGPPQSFAYSTLPTAVTLSGNALNGPITAWEWTMIAVPSGSTADTGVNGGFTDGVATTQNPGFTADVSGCFLLRLRAQNAEGWSEPAYDKEEAQTPVYILTANFDYKIPGPGQYDYDLPLNETLNAIEGDIAAHSSRHENGGADEIDVGGLSGVLADAQNADQIQGRDVSAVAPTNGQVYKWNSGGSEWVAGSAGGNHTVAMALNENTDSAVAIVVGARGLTDTFFTDMVVTFAATAYVTAGGLTGTIELYNLTDAASVKTLTFTELVSTHKESTTVTLAAGSKVYEIRISVAGGGGPADMVACMWAGLTVTVP